MGYTRSKSASGVISGATIELEDPTQDALIAGSNGTQTYTGTNATLEQALLHEIGHALGLADDTDSSSIMYYELTSSNRTLDSTDLAGIKSLYGSASGAVQSSAAMSTSAPGAAGMQAWISDQLGQMVASMAAFNAQHAAATTHIAQATDLHLVTLAASSH